MKSSFPVSVVVLVSLNSLDIEKRIVMFWHGMSDMAPRFENVSLVGGILPVAVYK